MHNIHPFAVWLFFAVQALGLLSAVLARLGEGRRCQDLCQHFFLLCLSLVSASAAAGLTLGPVPFLISGAVLSFMVLGAVWDFNHSRQPAL